MTFLTCTNIWIEDFTYYSISKNMTYFMNLFICAFIAIHVCTMHLASMVVLFKFKADDFVDST